MSSIKQVSVEQEDHSYLSEPIGVDADQVDIDENHTLADKAPVWDNKVDKVQGKGLSTNDFTNNDKLKLNNLSNYDDTSINGRVSDIENIIPSNATADNKLATIADIESAGTGAEANTIESISVNGVPQPIINKNVDLTIGSGGCEYPAMTSVDIDRLWKLATGNLTLDNWVYKLWNMPFVSGSFNGSGIWTDGDNIYYS